MTVHSTFQALADSHQVERFLVENAADTIAALHQNAVQINPSEYDYDILSKDMQGSIKHRLEAGCFRQCHGDLRLVNLSRVDEQTVFSQHDFTAMDLVQDLTVLLSDLESKGLRPQSNILFNRYFDVTGGVIDDPDTLSVLAHYMSKNQSELPSTAS